MVRCLECEGCRIVRTKDGTPIRVYLLVDIKSARASEAYFCMGGCGTYFAPIEEDVKCDKYHSGKPSAEYIDYPVPMGFVIYPPWVVKEEKRKKKAKKANRAVQVEANK